MLWIECGGVRVQGVLCIVRVNCSLVFGALATTRERDVRDGPRDGTMRVKDTAKNTRDARRQPSTMRMRYMSERMKVTTY
jgi:hypothetical protein